MSESSGGGGAGAGGGRGEEEDAAAGARRHIFPRTRDHARSQCDECWVDIEAAHPLRGAGINVHDNHRNGGRGDDSRGSTEQRRAVMRAPGREEGKDEVVVETMIEVSHAENHYF